AAPRPAAPPPAAPSRAAPAPAEKPQGSIAGSVTIDDVRRQWARVLEDIKRVKMLCHALLIEGTPLEVTGSTLVVGLRSGYNFHLDNLHRAENREVIEGALSRVLSHPLRFRACLHDAPAAGLDPPASSPEHPAAGGGPAPRPAAAKASLVERARELFAADIVEEDDR
ncbi:MAG: hypothetical protein RDU83_13610, partial [bacterium]|nr:hypothetical protein [bacterium]